MAAEPGPSDAALRPLAPGPLLALGCGRTVLALAPQAGGRIAQILHAGVDWLAGYAPERAATLSWGCFPMLPWAGRVRHGRFDFGGQSHQLPATLGAHAIHGVGYAMPWRIEHHGASTAELSLALPRDARWPFGGHARQSFRVRERVLELRLTLTAGRLPMPAVLGWHPWFVKPERLHFTPRACYPRDAEGIAGLPPGAVPPPPWDDCFLATGPIVLERAGQRLELSSDCGHWVVYDAPADTTCVEPQSAPPDAFNLGLAEVLAPGATLTRWFRLAW